MVNHMTNSNHNHKAAGGALNIYRVRFPKCSKYLLALNPEDAAWQAYELSKELDEQLLDVIKVNG